MKPTTLGSITTTIKRNFRYKPAASLRPRFYDLTIDEQSHPTAADTLTNAIRLYSTLRVLWRKGRPQEDGILYVKVKGEFVEVKMKRSKF
jgi:hypothetical protein